jgi:hypothetical protein
MNATGASDIRLFYDYIKSLQSSYLRPRIERLLRIVMKSADGPTGGVEPEQWSFEFRPLWQMNDKETAELRKMVAETDAIYISNGVLTPEEVTQSRYGGDKWSMETVIDEDREEDPATPDEKAMIAAMSQLQPPQPPSPPPVEEPTEAIEPERADGLARDMVRLDFVREVSGKWVVFSSDGSKKLGVHKTREEAIAQLRAIEASKRG